MWTVLLVEDEVFVRESVRRIVDWESMGFTVIGEAGNGEEALEIIREQGPDLVISDILMPKMNGVELLRQVREEGSESLFIMLSCMSDFEYVRQAMEYGASNYILKLSMKVQSLMDALMKVDAELRKREMKQVQGERTPQETTQELLEKTGHAEVDKLISYLKEHYGQEISLKLLAGQVSMDEKYVSTLFKKKTGMNILQFMHTLRIEESKRLLLQTDLTVSEIGTRAGYENDNYFIKMFKRFTGLTPSVFRIQHRAKG